MVRSKVYVFHHVYSVKSLGIDIKHRKHAVNAVSTSQTPVFKYLSAILLNTALIYYERPLLKEDETHI
jgi:hypothetical protein